MGNLDIFLRIKNILVRCPAIDTAAFVDSRFIGFFSLLQGRPNLVVLGAELVDEIVGSAKCMLLLLRQAQLQLATPGQERTVNLLHHLRSRKKTPFAVVVLVH